ncbi:peptidase domain-containing ABC transporter [Helcococcus ovis]|uniref:Peptidase domain-containing ABC transporter n=1 Tax=Helcococcus ovis TaxID=72026 RepID=A0A4R9C2B2_9FIRM|nr:peptidase domain-containing ABC transporter [Helcococcus ovis]TFF67026.1 peptidase domain-containing ABC transporter [Helcococcus ovis]
MLKKYHSTLQHDQSDCAAAVVSTIIKTYGLELSIMKIREIIGTDIYGTTVKGVVYGLEKLNFSVKAVRFKLSDLNKKVTLPAILQVKTLSGENHFIVLHKILRNNKFLIDDPAIGLKKINNEELDKIFLGIAIFMIPKSDFEVKKDKSGSMFNIFKQLILPQKKLFITIIFTSLLLSIFGILSSIFSKILMDEVIPYKLKNTLFVFLFVFGLVSILQTMLSAFRKHILLFLSRKVDIPVLMGYYNHIIHLPYIFFSSRKTGDIITRFQDAMTIKDIFTSVSISLILDIGLSLISTIVLININLKLFLILFVMVLINIILIYIFKKPYKEINKKQMEAGAVLNSQLIESLQNVNTVKALNDEENQLEKLEYKFVNTLKIAYEEGVLSNIQGSISSLINTLGGIIFMAVGALFIIDGKMSIGDLLVFQSISQYFTEPIQNLVGLQLTFQESSIAINRLNELMDLKREDENIEHKIKNIDLKKDINFDDLSFAYGSRPNLLNNFNLNIKQGEKFAFVGDSGAGKSTIVKLLLKFIEPNAGKISIGEYDLSDIDSYFLRNKIAYIPQEIELFSGTIIENLKIGNQNASYEEIISVCKMVGIHNTIDRLQNKYMSYIEEKGGNLSGGEKQRLAIARALLSDSDIYIFDEATSNLDSFSEKIIQDLIFNKIKNKTVIIIAHRISTIVNCDRICLIKSGQIKELGTHEELYSQGREYHDMVNIQNNFIGKSENMGNSIITEKDEITYE